VTKWKGRCVRIFSSGRINIVRVSLASFSGGIRINRKETLSVGTVVINRMRANFISFNTLISNILIRITMSFLTKIGSRTSYIGILASGNCVTCISGTKIIIITFNISKNTSKEEITFIIGTNSIVITRRIWTKYTSSTICSCCITSVSCTSIIIITKNCGRTFRNSRLKLARISSKSRVASTCALWGTRSKAVTEIFNISQGIGAGVGATVGTAVGYSVGGRVGPAAGGSGVGAGVGTGVGAGVGFGQQVVGLIVPARAGLQVQTPGRVQLVDKVQVPCPQQPLGHGFLPGHPSKALQT